MGRARDDTPGRTAVIGHTTSGRTDAAARGVVELSVYVDPAQRASGVGRLLLDALVAATEEHGVWTVQAGVFPENAASVALHKSAGFREVGTRTALGRMTYGPMAGRWRDVLLLERRSRRAGV